LIASLLYVSKIKQENDQSATISIHCRHPKFRVSSLLGGPQWQLECVILKGNCTWNITYSSNLSQNPIASIHMEKIDAGTSIRIDIVIGNYGFVISGGYVRLKSLPKKIKATKLNLSGVNPVKTEKPSRPRSAILKSPKSKQHQPRIVAVKEINAKSRSMSDVFRSGNTNFTKLSKYPIHFLLRGKFQKFSIFSFVRSTSTPNFQPTAFLR
jgi:hypothetical protein